MQKRHRAADASAIVANTRRMKTSGRAAVLQGRA